MSWAGCLGLRKWETTFTFFPEFERGCPCTETLIAGQVIISWDKHPRNYPSWVHCTACTELDAGMRTGFCLP